MPDAKPKYGTRDLSMAVLSEKMDTVIERLNVALDILSGYDTRLRTLETDDVLNKRDIEAAHRRMDGADQKLKAIEDSLPDDLKGKIEKMSDVLPVVRFLKWAGAVVGVLIIGLLWAIFTGTVKVFP